MSDSEIDNSLCDLRVWVKSLMIVALCLCVIVIIGASIIVVKACSGPAPESTPTNLYPRSITMLATARPPKTSWRRDANYVQEHWPQHELLLHTWREFWRHPMPQIVEPPGDFYEFGKGYLEGHCHLVSEIGVKCYWQRARV